MNHIGRETKIRALGQEWTLARWDRGVWKAFLDWAKTVLPDPVKIAQQQIVERNMPPAMAEVWVKVALEKALTYISVGSDAVQSLIGSPDGASYLIYLLLQKNHPGTTLDKAGEIFFDLDPEKLKKALDKSSGTVPQGNASAPPA